MGNFVFSGIRNYMLGLFVVDCLDAQNDNLIIVKCISSFLPYNGVGFGSEKG